MGATIYSSLNLPKIGDKIEDSKISIYKWEDGVYDINYWIKIEKYGWLDLPLDDDISNILRVNDIDTTEMSIEEFEKIIQND